MKVEAQFYENIGKKVKCRLCPLECSIADGKKGKCKVRQAGIDNDGNLKLYTLNYGEVSVIEMEPVEKKPLKKFGAGKDILSVGSYDAKLSSKLSKTNKLPQKNNFISVDEILKKVIETPDNIGIAFTFKEPAVWYEYVYDAASNLKRSNFRKKVILVTNGYINEGPLRRLLPYVDAMNIDLKATEDFYKNISNGIENKVLNTIKIASDMGIHVEVRTTLLEGENTDIKQLRMLGDALNKIDKNIVLHLAPYTPVNKKENENPTTELTLRKSQLFLKLILPNVEVLKPY